MFFHRFGKNCRKDRAMSAAVIGWAEALIARERGTGLSKPEAIKRVSARARVSPGQIEGLLRGRVKDPKVTFAERLRAAFIHETRLEIERLAHALETASQAGLDPDCRQVRKARLAMARLNEALGGE